MDLFLPDVRLAKVAPRMMDATGRFASPLNGTVRTVGRPGDRWGFRLDWASLTDMDRARIESMIALQRGAVNRILIAPQDYKTRGTLDVGELVPNNAFQSGTLGWTAASATFTVTDRVARIANTTTTTGRITSPLIPLTTGRAYVVRAVAMAGNQSAWKIAGGTTAGASDVFNLAPSATDQIGVVGFIATSANFYLSLFCNSAVANDFVFFSYCSLTTAALVNGANQSGSGLNIDGLPISVNNLFVPGDWIGIGMELKRVVAAAHSNSSGAAYLQFAPPLRSSPADNSPVVVNDPLGRFIMSGNTAGWETEPGKFATLSIDFVEAI